MEKAKYDIFISYRRIGGKNYARTLKPELEKRGFRVFLDFDELKDGVFDKRIMDAINEAPIFLVILSKGALDRCANEGDWVREEILYADKTNRHIVPVEVDKTFREFPENLPNEVKSVLGPHQFSQIDTETLWQESIDKMVHDRIKPYVSNESTKTPIKEAENTDGAEIHIEVDVDCDLYRFKKLIKALSPNEDNIVYLKPGKHKIEFVSHEYSDIKESKLLDIPYQICSDLITVTLLPQIEKKKKDEIAEEEAKRKAEIETKNKKLAQIIGSVLSWKVEVEAKHNAEEEAKRKAEIETKNKGNNIAVDPNKKNLNSKTFLDYYKNYQRDKSFRFSLYYIVKGNNVKGKSPRVKKSNGWTFLIGSEGWISFCNSGKYFGLFKKEEDLNTSILKDNWNYTAKTAYLNKEDAEKELIKVEAEEVSLLKKPHHVMKVDNRYGYANRNNKVVIPCQWTKANEFVEGIGLVWEDKKMGAIDEQGDYYFPCEIKCDEANYLGHSLIKSKDGNLYSIHDLNGKDVEYELFTEMGDEFVNGYLNAVKYRVFRKNKPGRIDTEGKFIAD